ncbi:YcaO-like family protein [Serratia ureilytica]|uniref:YcaO-like family protein n=1 Tax=Serratia ureilytica TaxID=300181 RepID=UPI00159C384F|nr:YcaO-like family protein [Serratia ureilytica]MBH2895417.1 YcaO-like family protein [Serratia ureilytica]MBH3018445.1 YcaO-like family protein [Serratia ureilytica]MBH3033011.1 YcaO-like family protein [Serratia ureilytica]NVM49256.1 YcaO-like family protein [Serratia ureilytica]
MHHHNFAVSASMRQKYPFMSLLSPLTGVVGSVYPLEPQEMHIPRFSSVLASLGNLSMPYPHIIDNKGNDLQKIALAGCGADEHVDMAIVRAVAEAAERYATCVYHLRDVSVASFRELGADGLAADSLPRCSEEELADPLCPVKPIDDAQPLRWVEGYSLTDSRPRKIPLIMSHLYVRPWESERFWLPISTGVAAHTDLTTATVTAINEVIERDAIALTWLLQMPLARIRFDEPVPDRLQDKFSRLAASGLEQLFFDATTDIGCPTIYGLQLRDGHPTSAQFVNCSTGFDPWGSCGKIIRESAMGRSVLEHQLPVPDDIRDFIALEHGAIFMGRAEQRSAFDFLTASERQMPISRLQAGQPQTPAAQLKKLVARFRQLKMDVVIADMTTDELRDAGLHVVRAVIPALLPMTACYRARYLGHPRLREQQQRLSEQLGKAATINPWPQPFA